MKMEGVLAVALISNEGFPIYSALPQGMDETRVGAMTAALVSLGIRACKETRKGNLNILYIQGDEGKILLVDCGSDFVLTISLDDTINKEQLFTQHFQTIDLLRATIADLSLIQYFKIFINFKKRCEKMNKGKVKYFDLTQESLNDILKESMER